MRNLAMSLVSCAALFAFLGTALAGDGFIFDVGERVPSAEVGIVKDGLALAQDHLNEYYGGGIAQAFASTMTIRIVADGQRLTGFGCNGAGANMSTASGSPQPCFDVAHEVWKYNPGWGHGPEKLKIVAHEYTHAWQAWLGAITDSWQPLGDWIDEGVAEYIAYDTIIAAGKTSKKKVDRFMIGDAATATEFSRPLYAYGTSKSPEWSGHMGYIAIDWLVSESPNGRMSLRIIATEIAAHKPLTTAFRNAFNIDLKDFYLQFEAWRQVMVRNPIEALSRRPNLVNIGE